MNQLDIIIVVVMAVTLFWGFRVGLIRQSLNIISLYIGIVIATLGYENLGRVLRGLSSSFAIDASNTIAFLLITLVVTSVLIGITYVIYQDTELRALGMFDHILGSAAGLVNGLILLGILLVVLHFALLSDWGAGNHDRDMFSIAQKTSFIAPLLTQVSDILLAMIRPWTQGQLPLILQR